MAINYFAVLVAGIVGFLIGAVWYSNILFGRTWMKTLGLTKKDIQKAKKRGLAKHFIAGFIVHLITAYVLAFFIIAIGVNGYLNGALTGFYAWIGFVATTGASSVIWQRKPKKLYLLNTLCFLVTFVVMGAILAAW